METTNPTIKEERERGSYVPTRRCFLQSDRERLTRELTEESTIPKVEPQPQASRQEEAVELSKPVMPLVTALGPTEAFLDWVLPEGDIPASYQILVRYFDVDPIGEFTVLIDDTMSREVGYTLKDLQPNTRYVFRIRARHADGRLRSSLPRR